MFTITTNCAKYFILITLTVKFNFYTILWGVPLKVTGQFRCAQQQIWLRNHCQNCQRRFQDGVEFEGWVTTRKANVNRK